MKDEAVHLPERGSRRRVLRWGAYGLAFGGLAGYLAALVLPRRVPSSPSSYEAPVPASFVPAGFVPGQRGWRPGAATGGTDVRREDRAPAGTA